MPDTLPETIASFIADAGITASVAKAESNPNMADDVMTQHFLVTLRLDSRTMAVPYGGGPLAFAASGGQPTVADVLDSLRSDASSADQSFGDWCADYGYDEDSRRAYATWQAVQHQTAELRTFLGEALFDRLLEAEGL